MSSVGAVAIGRNEGDRLRLCLESLVGRCAAVVYVDSGSTDGSVALARSLGVEIVELDLSIPFTAARARNAGFDRLLDIAPELPYVQFVDGDCEVVAGWPDRASSELDGRPDAAVVCGRRRERYPDRSVYNRLADIEWDTPVGEAKACGGDALIRVSALVGVGGYDPGVIAAEDDELCLRLRRDGWAIIRVEAEMTTHDMAMTRFHQWWRRSVRTGYAYADGFARHGVGPERHFVREVRGVLIWGILLPATMLAAAWPTRGLSPLFATLYIAQAARIRARHRRRGMTRSQAGSYAAFCVLGKFPQAVGMLRYATGRLFRHRVRIIEYKGSGGAVCHAVSRAGRDSPPAGWPETQRGRSHGRPA